MLVWTDDEVGAIVLVSIEDEVGAIVLVWTDDEVGAIVLVSIDDEVVIGAAIEEDGAIGAADDDGAIDEETGASELEAVFTVVVVGVPRLKIQIRPMITITATMMIIQVLRFMG